MSVSWGGKFTITRRRTPRTAQRTLPLPPNLLLDQQHRRIPQRPLPRNQPGHQIAPTTRALKIFLRRFAYNFPLPAHNRSMSCLQGKTTRPCRPLFYSQRAIYHFLTPSPPPLPTLTLPLTLAPHSPFTLSTAGSAARYSRTAIYHLVTPPPPPTPHSHSNSHSHAPRRPRRQHAL